MTLPILMYKVFFFFFKCGLCFDLKPFCGRLKKKKKKKVILQSTYFLPPSLKWFYTSKVSIDQFKYRKIKLKNEITDEENMIGDVW